ncbi:nucleoprotein TPR-like isoform X38 [Astyanax mexicanus]|uniref:nucleoprotein TPR-like isoform X23 n=1 Tax=Astyanax mexicanus TaxID=7994 RepID=UPI0020CACA41|nr:nucleoprotein TPR-like isoform X23 [Astyanax mexicanus]XP_049325268.1 nucleoprotein TPR-like isoform X24 [Astyanax mexicanus]XP_049325276.1 nucleoprotein TPR-like isoform X31 [Astyanax mexicanus]XP_049325277.1 nucleoprotein TPR-like isoform X32 [Astyanax mexicanus]XP_049325278.1 nucleoprotein TPR-like isoform X33 [Astyanax mexicanus]XP_049325279.1 nucleoprotein TPR-like isoform X34 [Astyanax mexicanus]XP_049325280.1 nucleoprotein TPR-like isoform X35 [Astyanax mexicanus]XP_049325281.1 nuc
MGWIQLLLLGFLSSCFTCSSGVWGYRIERSPDERFRQLCEGVEVELKNCNLRLAEKIKNTTGIEKEMFTLKRQLRQLRLTCKDASQAASVQISALQNQLDSLLKQLGESTSGPANEVMIIMKKYINMKKLEMDMTMQSDTSKISLMQDQLKALEAELKQKTAALKEVKCSADGGGEEAEISRIVEEINKLSLEGSTSAEISRLAGLKTILDKKLNKMDGTGFATSEKISVIMEGNKQMVVIQRKLADLLKTEAEYTALLQRLKVKKVLLSDLKEEKNEKGPNPELSKHITVVEKEVWALEDELELLKRTLSRREVLEKELLQKKKQVEGKLEELKKKMELFSRLLSVQLELQVTQVRWMGEKAAAEVFIKDLQKHLEEKEDKISRLLAKNIYLDKKLADLMAECDDIQVKFNELSDQLEATLGKLPNTNLKYVLEIVTLNIDIDSIRETITREKSLSKIEELKKLLKKKTDELNLKKYELKNKDPSAVKILVIIEKTKEIQNLQSSVVNVNDLDSISKLQKELIKLIDDLDDSNPAKLVLKNMVMLSEESWLKKLINKMNQRSQQQITDLEKVLKETEETLKYKTAELVKTGSYADQLIKDIVVLRGDVKKIKEELSRLQVSSVSQVAELEKMLTKTKQELEKGNRSLNDKDAELAKNMARITQLIEELRQTKLRAQENDEEAAATIADLEKRVRKSEEEKNRVKQENRKLQEDLREARKCTEVHESYSELQDKYDKEVSKLSNNFARQVLTIKTLSDEVSLLKSKLSVATGNTDALEAELKKKSGDLMKVMKELEKSKVDSSEMVKLLEAMRKLNKQQDQSIAEYLAEIDALGKEMEGLTAKLGTRGDEKAQLTIQVMVLKEEISKLEKLQSDLKQEAVKKTESLKNEIEETKKEIIFLKRSGCKTEETKQQIDRLQVEVKAKERELEKLKQNSEAEQDQLAEKLAQIAKKLESSGVELKKKDAQNAELIQQLLDLGQKLKDSQSGQNTIKEEAEKQINDLEKRVRKSEEEKNRVKQENRKLQEDLREARKCTEVHESYSELQDKYDKEVSKLSNNFARQVLTIKTLSDEVNLLKSKLSVATGNTDALEAELKKKSGDLMKVMKELEKSKVDSSEMVKLLEAMRKLDKQQDQSIAEYLAEIDALGKEMEGLTAKLGTRGDEKAQLTIQVMVLKEEISKLEKLQSDLKQEAVKKSESLKNEIEETKKEIIFLKRSGCKTEETKQQIDRLQVEVKAKERELEKLKQNSEAEQDQLAEKLAQIAKKLESSGVELKKKDAQNAELIQQLLDLGQKLKDSQSGQNTIKEEAEKQINDLEKRVRKSEEEKNRVKQENRKLQEDLREARKCTEVHESYSELQDKYDKEVSKLSNNFARQVLTIKTLSDEVSLLKSKLSVATGNTDALEAELKKKSGDLMKVMKELEKSKVDSSEMVKLLEAMRKLDKQQDQSIAEYLAEIDALGKEMEGLTAKLGTRGDEKAQLTIQVMVLKEEISKLEKLQSDLKQEAVKKTESLKNEIEETKKEIIFLKRSGCKTEETKQQIDRLQVEVKAKERELEKLKQNSEAEQDQLAEKLAQIAKKLESSGVELKKKDAQNAELIQQLLDLGQKLKDSQSGQNTIKEEAEKQINDLKIKLKNKEVELSQLKISNSDLEERVRKSEEEKNRVKQENRKLQEDLKEARKCTEVHESYSELQTKFDKDVSKLTNDFARQVLTIQTLSDEVTALQNKLSKSEGNTDALQVELKKKTADLEKVTKELSKSKLGSAETVKLLEAMRKLNKQQDQSIAEYLAEIDALGKDMEGLMAKLGSRGDEKAQLTIQVMVLKEEISKLEKLQSDLKQEAVKKTESLKNEIEETKKEIIFLKRSGCKTEETKQQIDRLQLEVKAKERELEKLKKNTEAELDQLMEKLSEKTKKLEFSGKELSEKDEQNAKLIQQLIDLGQKMKETQSGQKTIKEEAEKQINDLKQQLQKKEEDVSKLKQSNTDLKEQVKNKDKDVSQLNNEKAALNAELGKKKEELIKAEKEVKVKEEAIDNVKKELKTKEEEIKGGCSEVTKKLKSKEEEVTKLKESHKNTLNENEKLKTQISDTDAKLQELEELERENEELQKELAKVQEEYKNKIEETKTNAFTVVSPEWDPDTAHPQLLLTSKGKAVKASEFARFVPDNPERFNAALAALGKKGYDSGKPYWEVDVDIRACFVVGVAKKSANRKGSLAYGPKNGYWVIVRRKDGQYHALNDKSTPLKLPVKPTVIGVLLDFNKGNVVFFNAKTKKPIYTYHNNKFSETLFPYIETCHSQGKNEPPIVVSDADSVLMDNVS